MRLIPMLLLLPLVLFAAAPAMADAPLQSRLGLSLDQAREVDAIQADTRRRFAAARQDFNRESRALRRARLAKDAAGIARLEQVTESLRAELRRIRDQGDARIRALLDPAQQQAFEAWIEERRRMQGSARDERLFD